MAIPGFLKVKGETVFYDGNGEFLLFIPEVYFDRTVAIVNGEYVETLGILDYSIISENDKDITKNLKTFYFPSKFTTKPGKIEKVKDFQITKNFKADYRILHYTNNSIDEIISSTKVPQDIDNVTDFFRLFVDTGNIPKTIRYDDLWKYVVDSMRVNGYSYDLSISMFGVMISELCRDPSDINKPFRLSKAIDQDMCSYTPISVKTVPKLVSPFAALTSENFDESIVGAIMNKNNTPSPMEKVLTG